MALSRLMVTSSIIWVLGDLCFLGVLINASIGELAKVLGVSGIVKDETGFG